MESAFTFSFSLIPQLSQYHRPSTRSKSLSSCSVKTPQYRVGKCIHEGKPRATNRSHVNLITVQSKVGKWHDRSQCTSILHFEITHWATNFAPLCNSITRHLIVLGSCSSVEGKPPANKHNPDNRHFIHWALYNWYPKVCVPPCLQLQQHLCLWCQHKGEKFSVRTDLQVISIFHWYQD